jgi:CubicO group peptidase (beta-lactamase class C family)
MRRPLLVSSLCLVPVIAAALFLCGPTGQRVMKAQTLFDRDEIAWNFTHMAALFPAVTVTAADHPSVLTEGTRLTLPETFTRDTHPMNTAAFLRDTELTGLLVLQDGQIVHEEYRLGHTATQQHISWSLAKSTISAMLGIAVAEGHIHSVMDPVDRYAPALANTVYAGVPLRDVLHMASGVHFDENYDAPFSDVVTLARAVAFGGDFNAVAQGLGRDHPPGTVRHYSSFDTQVLAMVLQGATGRPVSRWMQEKLWQPMGAEADAAWLVDGQGMVMGFGGFNAVLRDYGRFGLLYLNDGRVDGKQVVPAEWIRESLRMDAAHLTPGVSALSDSPLGYGYQWWIPDDAGQDFMGIGVYNQFIYISPSTRTVIVKNSANHRYTTDDYEITMQHLAFFRAVAAAAAQADKGTSPP